MEFCDRFFKFPVKIYANNKFDDEDTDDETLINLKIKEKEREWVRGYVRIHYTKLLDISFEDDFSTGRTVKEVADKGFDLTYVKHTEFGSRVCLWKREKFEKELNAFYAEVDKYLIEKQLKESLEDIDEKENIENNTEEPTE